MQKPVSAYRGDGPYVFVCYSHEDSDAVLPEITWLTDYGVNVWYDEGISPGHEWSDELAKAIQGCTKVFYFVTPNSVVSEHCRRELNFAQEEGREAVAIHLQPTEVPAGLRLSLNNRQAILKYELSDEEYRKRLMRVTHAGSGPTPTRVSGSRSRPPRLSLILTLSATALVILAVGIWWSTTRQQPSTDAEQVIAPVAEKSGVAEMLPNSIAVLPFENLSPDPNNAYFAAGIHEEILNQLAKIKDLSVIARATMIQFANSRRSIQEIGSALKVRTVMSGSVRYASERVRILIELIDAATGEQLWSEAYEDNLQDIFGIQLAIATQVADSLQADFLPQERARVGTRTTKNPVAYTHYLRALNNWGSFHHTELHLTHWIRR